MNWYEITALVVGFVTLVSGFSITLLVVRDELNDHWGEPVLVGCFGVFLSCMAAFLVGMLWPIVPVLSVAYFIASKITGFRVRELFGEKEKVQ